MSADDSTPQIVSSTTLVSEALHATSLASAKSILQNGFREAGVVGFLGKGSYFYHALNAESMARGYAEGQARLEVIERPLAILRAGIELGSTLDLEREEHYSLVARLADELRKRTGKAYKEGDAIEALAEKMPIPTVRAPYHERILPDGRIYKLLTYYICVRDLSKILSLQLHTSWN